MEREWAIVLPTRDNSGHRIRSAVLEDIVRNWSEHFGGSTAWHTAGCYSTGEELQCEPGILVESVRTEATAADIAADERWVSRFAADIARLLGQQALFEQEVTGTRTTFRPGERLAELPADLLEPTAPAVTPTESFARFLREGTT